MPLQKISDEASSSAVEVSVADLQVQGSWFTLSQLLQLSDSESHVSSFGSAQIDGVWVPLLMEDHCATDFLSKQQTSAAAGLRRASEFESLSVSRLPAKRKMNNLRVFDLGVGSIPLPAPLSSLDLTLFCTPPHTLTLNSHVQNRAEKQWRIHLSNRGN
jgi:hypothetical protein